MLGDKLRELKIKQVEIAEWSGLRVQTVNAIANGGGTTIKTAQRICAAVPRDRGALTLDDFTTNDRGGRAK